jgi:hypothetical protein
LLNKAASVEQYYRFIHADASAGNEGILEDLTGTSLRIEYCQDCAGFWLSPHTDIGVKKFTMQIYLSKEPGSQEWGTDLLDEQKVTVRRVPSTFNAGMIFIPGSNTWHAFAKRPIQGVRKSILVNYVGPEWRARHELCFPDEPISPPVSRKRA